MDFPVLVKNEKNGSVWKKSYSGIRNSWSKAVLASLMD